MNITIEFCCQSASRKLRNRSDSEMVTPCPSARIWLTGFWFFLAGLSLSSGLEATETSSENLSLEIRGNPSQQIIERTQPEFPERPADVDAQTWAGLHAAVQQTKLLPEPAGIGGQGSEFGYSVSIKGNRALIGGINLLGSGAALVMIDSGNGWVEEAVLLPADGAPGDHFGATVSLGPNRAIVGAPLHDNSPSDSGAAWVFEFDGKTWAQAAKLTAAGGASHDQFGFAVSLDGSRALVGAPLDDFNGNNSGAAWVFDFDGTTWTQTAKLTVPDSATDVVNFGKSVSLDGDRALVGAPHEAGDDGSSSAWIFNFNGAIWAPTAELTPLDSTPGNRFGWSVSLDGKLALVGAPFDDYNGSSSGAAYAFAANGTTWAQAAKLTVPNAAGFGWSVSLDGSLALVGARFGTGLHVGTAYVFAIDDTSWAQTAKLMAPDGAFRYLFGSSVSLDGNRALVGVPGDRGPNDNAWETGAAWVFHFDGTTLAEMTKLTAPEGAAGDHFGWSVSLDGNRALVGAPFDDDKALESGAAYVFDFDGTTWTMAAKLIAADGADLEQFGFSVDLSGTRALVGACCGFHGYESQKSGSAYVFDFDGTNWTQTAKLTPPDDTANDQFGWSVSLSGSRTLVGARFDGENGSESGAVYVFDFDGMNWARTAKLTAPEGSPGDQFGWSISLAGNRALVGAPFDDVNGSDSGAAYVFDFDGKTWAPGAKLEASHGTSGGHFGCSVSLDESRALVGAGPDDTNGSDAGAAYVFDLDETDWTQTAKLTASDGANDGRFGCSVSLEGSRALVGTEANDDNGSDAGAAYVFDFDGTTWTQTATLTVTDGAPGDQFGFAVSLDGDRALVGAPYDDDNGSDSGSAYIFLISVPTP